MMRSQFVVAFYTVACLALPVLAQDKKPEPPAIRVVAPLALWAREKATLRIRGVGLDTATELRATDAGGRTTTVRIKSKGKAEAKDDAAKKAGETQLEAELESAIPTAGTLTLVAVTPAGETAPVALPVIAGNELVNEAEPNGGFKTAQVLAADVKAVRGAIGEEKDVDVYRVIGKAGQTISVKVRAAAIGSALDARLSIHNAAGLLLATADDGKDTRDPAIDLKVPADGEYLIVVTDANDRGGAPTHPYLLTVDNGKPIAK